MNNMFYNIAKSLASKNIRLMYTHGSLFNTIHMTRNDSETINSIVNQLSNILVNDLNLVKETLIPLAKEYKALVKDYVNNTKVVNLADQFKINVYEIPELVNLLKDSGKLVAGTDTVIPVQVFVMSAPDDLKEYLKYNKATLQDELDLIVAEYKDSELLDIWNKYLNNVSGSNVNIDKISSVSVDKLNEYIILYTYISRAIEVKVEKLTSRDVNYVTVLRTLLNKVINAINGIVDKIELMTKFNRFVIKHDIENKTLTVYKPIYFKLLEEVKVEAILGAMIEENINTATTTDEIISKQETYISKWNYYVKLNNYKNTSLAPNNYRKAYVAAMKDILPKVLEDDVAANAMYFDNAATAVEVTSDYVKYIDELDTVDMDKVIMYIFGKYLFKNTPLYNFLDYMYDLHNAKPNLPTNEIYTLAVVNYVATYLISQVEMVDA